MLAYELQNKRPDLAKATPRPDHAPVIAQLARTRRELEVLLRILSAQNKKTRGLDSSQLSILPWISPGQKEVLKLLDAPFLSSCHLATTILDINSSHNNILRARTPGRLPAFELNEPNPQRCRMVVQMNADLRTDAQVAQDVQGKGLPAYRLRLLTPASYQYPSTMATPLVTSDARAPY